MHLNGFQYTLNKRGHNGNTYWRCADRSCPGRATLTEDDDVVSENNQHNHPPNPQQLHVSQAIDKMKERVTTEATPVPQVYRDTLTEMHLNPSTSGATANVPTLPSMKSSLYRKRRERLPPMPATIDDVSFDGDWALSLTKEQFLVQSEDNIHVFATEKNLYLLAQSEELYIDGTFKIAPRLFHQVLTVHCFKHGKQFPLVYCLLPGKSRSVYDKCFSIIGDKVNNLGFLPVVQRITTDFELALIQAAEAQFPGATSKGCFFHFSQAVWQRVQQLGLQQAYRTDPSMSKFVSKIVALSFCPVRFVRVSWIAIKANAPLLTNVDDLCEYFENTWLNGDFPLRSWNHYDTDGPRTNNHVEGWHSKMNTIAGKVHPNVFELVELFQTEQATTEVTLQQLAAGGAVRRRGRYYCRKDRCINRIKEMFVAGSLTLDEYIDKISSWMGFL